jgi:hypothetical protein
VPEKNICRKARDAQESAGTVARPDPNVVDVRFGTMISAASRNPKASAAITRGVTASLSSRGGVGFWTDITSMDASPNARHWTTIIDTADSGRIVIAVEADEPIEPLALRSMLALPDVSDRWPRNADAATRNILALAELVLALVSGATTAIQSIFARPENCSKGTAAATQDSVIRLLELVPSWSAKPEADREISVTVDVAFNTDADATDDIAKNEEISEAGWARTTIATGLNSVIIARRFTVSALVAIGPKSVEKSMLHGPEPVVDPLDCVRTLEERRNSKVVALDAALFELMAPDALIVIDTAALATFVGAVRAATPTARTVSNGRADPVPAPKSVENAGSHGAEKLPAVFAEMK